ncbi:MAG: TnsA endonuclease N-terminal domain-containing protein [Gammaproteobacteria bacterium]|nr:TnsA endonuclease N-terminal domain-containing protein [Gammaproteobacteria bacterium]
MYRRNLRYSRVNNLYKFASSKMNTVYTVESSLEFDTCFHLEYSTKIIQYEAQPLGYKYQFEGKTQPYTPDFKMIDAANIETFIEVKPQSKTSDIDFKARFKEKRAAALELGTSLVLITERQIQVNPILNNLKLLHRYSGFQKFTPLQLKLLSLVRRTGILTVLQLSEQLYLSIRELMASVIGLISHGALLTDLSQGDFGMQSTVWVVGHEK